MAHGFCHLKLFLLSGTDQSMSCAEVWRQDYSLARISLSIRKGEIFLAVYLYVMFYSLYHVYTLSYSLFFSLL
mgnify:FL=1